MSPSSDMAQPCSPPLAAPQPAEANPNSLLAKTLEGRQFKPDDLFIAVMGMTGSGKSTFVQKVTGGDAKIGHDLASCTSDIEVFDFDYNGTTVHLIDTPGFNDTFRSDAEVLKNLVFWLNTAYRAQIRLSGIIYLHPIDQNRVAGSTQQNLRMFSKLCGDANLQAVVLATTKWSRVPEADVEKRQAQLKAEPDFWGDMIGKGSRAFRHEDSRASAMNLISYILDQNTTIVLEVQRQMIDEGKTLDETAAGAELDRRVARQRQRYEGQLRDAQDAMREAMEEGSRRAIEQAEQQQKQLQGQLDEAAKASENLKVSMQHLLEEKEAEHQKVIAAMQAEAHQQQEAARASTTQMEELMKQLSTNAEHAEEEQRRHQLELDEQALQMRVENAEHDIKYQQYLSSQGSQDGTSSKPRGAMASVGLSFADAAVGVVGTTLASAVMQSTNCVLM